MCDLFVGLFDFFFTDREGVGVGEIRTTRAETGGGQRAKRGRSPVRKPRG